MILTGKVDHGYLILCKPAKQSFPFPCRKREKRSRRAKARKKNPRASCALGLFLFGGCGAYLGAPNDCFL